MAALDLLRFVRCKLRKEGYRLRRPRLLRCRFRKGDQVKFWNLRERSLDHISEIGVTAGILHEMVMDQDKVAQVRDAIVEDPLDKVVGLNLDLGRAASVEIGDPILMLPRGGDTSKLFLFWG